LDFDFFGWGASPTGRISTTPADGIDICAQGGQLVITDSGTVVATLDPGLPYYMDMATTASSVFPFSEISFTQDPSVTSPVILADKAAETCADGLTCIGRLRSVGDCVTVDFTNTVSRTSFPTTFVLGDWISGAPTSDTFRNCSYYKNQVAIIFNFQNIGKTQVTYCPGLTFPTGTVIDDGEGVCGFNLADRVYTSAMPTSYKVCKTECGLNTEMFSSSCDPVLSIPFSLEGDFQIDGVSLGTTPKNLCGFYGDGKEGAFTSSCSQELS
jgi:hypothetical protein